MKKTNKPSSTFTAIVEVKYGRGKKAQTVKIPVEVKLDRIYVSGWQTESQALTDEAIEVMYYGNEIKNKVLNLKELKAAYKAWMARPDRDERNVQGV